MTGEYSSWCARNAPQDIATPSRAWVKRMRQTCQTCPQPSRKEKKGFSRNRKAVANTASVQGPCHATGAAALACREKKYAPTGRSDTHRMTAATRYQRNVFCRMEASRA